MIPKYAQSWEKLFSYITRGDVIRAMALYRLLEPTIEDLIYAAKLKSDILWSMGRSDSLDEYVRMAQQCEKQRRLDEALSIIKMLMKIAPETQEYHLMYAKLQRRTNNEQL